MARARWISGLLASVAVASIALAGSAYAGSTPPPPSQGAAVYSGPGIVTTCTGGRPTAVTFRFGYSGANLRQSYAVRVRLMSMSSDGSIQHTSTTVRYTIASHRTGTFTHTFPLRTDVRRGWQVYAEAFRPLGQYSSYTYVARDGTLSCTNRVLGRLTAPTVAFGTVNCQGIATITFDARHTSAAWNWIAFPKAGGFMPGPAALPAGRVTRVREHVGAGAVWEIAFNGSRGNIDVGRYMFRKGC